MIQFYRPKKRGIAAWSLLLLLVCVTGWAQSQSVTITGKVTDAETQQPLPGATVVVSGTSNGTIANADGNFSLSVQSADGNLQVQVSFIGYVSSKIPVTISGGVAPFLDVKLQVDVTSLDEVVVTGTGVPTEKKRLGNFVSTVKSTDLTSGAANNPLGALQGKIAGAQINQNNGNPAGGFSVRLRGASTILGSSEPLYIIDGVLVNNNTNNVTDLSISIAGQNDFSPGTNRLADINPNDIERIEVLNGAAAAAIYGSRANNGVVQIFTKRGVAGKPQITFTSSVMVSELRKRIPVNTHPERFGTSFNRFPVTQGEINDQRLTSIFLFNRLFPGKVPVSRYDYQDDIFQTALGTDNYVSVSGGNEKTTYLFSGSYFKNQGIIKGTDFSRYNSKLRIDQRINDWAKVSVGVNYVRSFANERPDGNSFYSPVGAFFITDNVYDINQRDAFGNLQAAEPVRLNPLSTIEGIKMTNTVDRIIGDIQAVATPLKGLSINYTLGVDTYSQVGETFIDRYPYPNVSALFFNDGYASNANQTVLQMNNDLTISYQKDFTPKIKSTSVLGGTVQYDESKFSQIQGRDMIVGVQNVNGVRNFFTPATVFTTQRSIMGAFLQETINYNDYLFVTLAGRVDASSVFGESNRIQFYPKASASLILSELIKSNFISETFDLLKLRVAYGEAGNLTNLGAYSRFSNYNPVAFTGNTRPFIRSQTQGNPDVGPERQKEIEIGLDATLLKGRLGAEINVYNKRVENLLLDLLIAPSTGSANINTNIGALTNKGFEIVVKGAPLKTKDLSWNVTVIFNKNLNAVELPSTLPLIRFSGDANRMSSAIDGRPLGVFYGTAYARNPDGSIFLTSVPRVVTAPNVVPSVSVDAGTPAVDRINRDAVTGLPTGALVQRELGDPNPNWNGSFLSDLSYKKVNFRFLLDAIQGFSVNNLNWTTFNNVGAGPLAQKELQGLLPRGTVSMIGGFGDERIREEMIEDGSFVKLREASIGYTFTPSKYFTSISVNLIGRNLISWDSYRGWDPEINSAGQSNRIRSDDFGTVPIPRSYQLSLTAKF
ncbi:MAG: SusC/RagA family TonB-linked outer membrane protein [Flammeovirgaceae bacterium]